MRVPAPILRPLRLLRRRWSCFDRAIRPAPRPRCVAATAEGSPLFDWSTPWRLRVPAGWPAGARLEVALSGTGAGRSRIRLRAGASECCVELASPGEWDRIALLCDATGARELELSVESAHPGAVRLGELRVVPDARSPVLRNLDRNRAEAVTRVAVLGSTPAKLTVETSSACNLRCVMCPHAAKRVERPKHLPEELLESLTPSLRRGHEIQLHGLGEPLLSPAFWKALALTSEQDDSEISINSNLTVLGPERIRQLLASRLAYVNVSLDAATPETFRRIRGHDLEPVLANVRALVAARDAGGHATPRVFVNMTLMKENVREAPELVSLARRIGADKVYLWHLNQGPAYDWTVENEGFRFDYREQQLAGHAELSNRMLRAAIERADVEGVELCLDQNKVVFFDEPAEARAGEEGAEGEATVADCLYPWTWAMINSEGGLRPCCFMPDPIGSLRDEPMAALWNGERMQGLRRDLARGVLHPACRDAACKYAAGSRRREAARPGA